MYLQIFLLIGLMTLSFITFSFLGVQMYRNKRRQQVLDIDTLTEIHKAQHKPFLNETT